MATTISQPSFSP